MEFKKAKEDGIVPSESYLKLISELRYALVITIILIVILLIPYALTVIDSYQYEDDYQAANLAFNEGDNFKAIELYGKLGNYKDSKFRYELVMSRMNDEIAFDNKMSKNRKEIELSVNILKKAFKVLEESSASNLKPFGNAKSMKVDFKVVPKGYSEISSQIMKDFKSDVVRIPFHSKINDYKYQNYIELNQRHKELVELYFNHVELTANDWHEIQNKISKIEALLKSPT